MLTWVGTCATSVCRAWERSQREDKTGSHLGNRSSQSTYLGAVLKTWTISSCNLWVSQIFAFESFERNKPVGLLKIGNVPESDDALTDETQRIERDPKSVPRRIWTFIFSTLVSSCSPHPCEQTQGMAINAEQVVGVPERNASLWFSSFPVTWISR